MKVGILELREYQFIQDVARQLSGKGTEVEFISLAEQKLPLEARHRVIIDRLSFQDTYLRQSMMLASLSGSYVINNPFSSTINNKLLHHSIIGSLGVKQPRTIALPRMSEGWELGDSVKEPDWNALRREISLPVIMKPYDGFAWEDVYVATTLREVENLYNSMKGRHLLLIQEKIEYTDYFRVFCINKSDVLIVKWDPKPGGLGVYSEPDPQQLEGIAKRITETTIKLNRAIDIDFNAVEWCIDGEGELCIIEAMNEVPEVEKKSMPEDMYWWTVEKFCDCVMHKLDSDERNRTIFDTHA
ncbi:MAG: hypothetical protein JXC85_01190 [Candidatus Aenigmarchaeota archaeon]|nr:hypothetical protein [Candidatus Aenigmarchaeota archaeon]